MQLRNKTFDYKWVILISCFLMEFICLGFCSSNPGLSTGAVTEALDIPRSLYAIGTSIRYIVQVVVALFFGPLIQRFGLKKLVGVGMFSLFGSIVMPSFTTLAVFLHADKGAMKIKHNAKTKETYKIFFNAVNFFAINRKTYN